MNSPPNPINRDRHGSPLTALRLASGIMNATNEELNQSVEACERTAEFSGIAVVVGLVVEVVLACRHASPDSFEGIWGSVIADSLVALGVAAEILFSKMGSARQRELQRRSDITVAEANERAQQAIEDAAETRERAAKIEQLTAWRHVPKEKHEDLVAFLRQVDVSILLLVEYQNGDAEAFSYACEIANVFKEAGIEVRGGANSYIGVPVFGLHISGSAEINMASMVKALEDSRIPFGGVRDVSAMAMLRGDPRPNLYMFVAPKMPPTLSI
jgi:hypothetical protein